MLLGSSSWDEGKQLIHWSMLKKGGESKVQKVAQLPRRLESNQKTRQVCLPMFDLDLDLDAGPA